MAPASRSSGGEGIRIYDGYIKTVSASGAGIGNGYGHDGSPGSIAIYGGIIRSCSNVGAGIGGGYRGRNGQIDIYGGKIQSISTVSGAGIGSGSEANQIADINIHGGTIIAQAAEGAGIGSGKTSSGSGGSITISDSTVTAVSPKNGAGIGTGDQSGVSLGAVTISHSTVTATGGAEAAGIGTGNESTVKAFNIEIKDHSIVTATGGEDGDGDAFLVSGRSTVEAVAGSDGWGKAVGYGDFNVFSVPSTGSVSISNGLRVKAGKSSDNTEDYVADDRFDAIRNYKYAKIYPCGHERAALKYHDYSAHGKYCADCKE